MGDDAPGTTSADLRTGGAALSPGNGTFRPSDCSSGFRARHATLSTEARGVARNQRYTVVVHKGSASHSSLSRPKNGGLINQVWLGAAKGNRSPKTFSSRALRRLLRLP